VSTKVQHLLRLIKPHFINVAKENSELRSLCSILTSTKENAHQWSLNRGRMGHKAIVEAMRCANEKEIIRSLGTKPGYYSEGDILTLREAANW
jgi:hypothetical protein